MAFLKKFRGIRFNAEKVNMSKVTALPYDVFNYGDEIDQSLRKDENNIVHIQKPEGEGDAKYRNAFNIFKEKLGDEILVQDSEENYYIYQQKTGGSVRTGIIAAVKLDDTYTVVKRHEKTKEGPKIDRLKLTKETGLNIGLVFTVFRDESREIYDIISKITDETEPLYIFEYPAGIENRLWKTPGTELGDKLKDKSLYIADGHHRYQTMIDYRNYLREKYNTTESDGKPYEYAMIFNVPSVNLTILPYNRVIHNIEEVRFENFTEKLSAEFDVKEIDQEDIYSPVKKREFGMYYKGKNYILTPKPEIVNESDVVKKLDVSLLQDHILFNILGIDDEKLKSGKYITYPRSEDDLNIIKDLVDNHEHQAGFSLFPTSIEELMDVADAGEVMPQKSTYFYPKLLTGMVLYQSDIRK